MGIGQKKAAAEYRALQIEHAARNVIRRNQELRRMLLRMTVLCIVALCGWGATVLLWRFGGK